MAKYANLTERILANSVPSSESYYDGTPCWVWIAKRTADNYPLMTMRYKRGPRKGKVYNARVHRVVVKEIKGRRLTPRMVVMHLCNNSLCVNPAHLIGGTQKQNVRQCVKDGRHFTPFRQPCD